MSLMIRLARAGTSKKPYYHVIVTNKRSPRDGKYIVRLGTYNPKGKDPKTSLQVDRELLAAWVKKGATVSETVGHLLKATAN